MHALTPGTRVRVDGTQPLDTESLTKVLDSAGSPHWSGVEVGASEGTRPVIDLWFATVLDTYGTLLTNPGSPPCGRCPAAPRSPGTPTPPPRLT